MRFVEIPLFAGCAKKPFEIMKLKMATYRGLLRIADETGLTLNQIFVNLICDDLGLPSDSPLRKVPVISPALARQRGVATRGPTPG